MKHHLLQKYLSSTASRVPERIAVIDGERSLTYAGLARVSAQLAWHLTATALPLRGHVGVYLKKSLEAIVSFHGVLEAGGCYVPLDADILPAVRVLRIIDLGDVSHIVTHSALWQDLLENVSAEERLLLENKQIVFIDTLLEKEELRSYKGYAINDASYSFTGTENTSTQADRASSLIDLDRAYILFTSGSTGEPKGVMISHRNAMTFIDWAVEKFQPHDGARFACHASINFDISVFDIYVSIATGGTLVLVPYSLNSNPKGLVQWIAENKINYWYSVPSVWISILNHTEFNTDSLTHLEWVLFAGEIFPASYLKRLITSLPEAKFVNLYGPTETNVCTWHQVQSVLEVGDRPVPIGLACENYEIVILNERHQPAKVGEEGELMVFGSGVTTGYYRNREATERAFIASPLPHHAGRLLYRTGDIVKTNADGLIEYVGRNDFMVKISGFRVELQDVESYLYKNPMIKRAVAISYFCDERGTQRLGALIQWHDENHFVFPSDAQVPTTSVGKSMLKFRNFLAEHSPRYMIPEIIFAVGDIPHNANGKVDRLKSTTLFKEWLQR